MASKIDKGVDIEFARKLLEESKNQLGLSLVPIRYTLEFGPKLHWQKGSLLGVNGTKLFVKPLTTHHGGKIEPTDPDKVHLWTSKMNPKQVALVKSVRQAIAEQSAKLASEPPAEIRPVVDFIKPQIESPPALNISQFAQSFNAYLALKQEIAAKAATEGIGYLSQLHDDYFAAMELASIAKTDIINLVPELKAMGVEIPSNLIEGILTVHRPPEPLPTPVERKIEPPVKTSGRLKQVYERPVLKARKNWCNGLANKHQDDILDYMERHAGVMLRGPAILKSLGIKASTPSAVLVPLVAKGLIQQFGVKAGTRYLFPKR